jgi:hypothetical protein
LIRRAFSTAAASGSEVLSLAEDVVRMWDSGSRGAGEQDRKQEKNMGNVFGPHVD